MKRTTLAKGQDLDKVKDLIGGTIIAPINELHQAYEHFVKTPGVEIVAIKEHLSEE